MPDPEAAEPARYRQGNRVGTQHQFGPPRAPDYFPRLGFNGDEQIRRRIQPPFSTVPYARQREAREEIIHNVGQVC